MIKTFTIRLRKLLTSITHPSLWHSLLKGIAPAIEHKSVLRSIGSQISGIIDVGANRGQFSLICDLILPGKPIFAFEPIPSEAKLFQYVHSRNTAICLHQIAIGSTPGESVLNLSTSLDSSSLLEIGSLQTTIFRNTGLASRIIVKVEPLDSFFDTWQNMNQLLLKIDVQGYELEVLKGATATLEKCLYVYLECSEIELYDGQALRKDVESFLALHSFNLLHIYNKSFYEGQLIQADYLFRSIRNGR